MAQKSEKKSVLTAWLPIVISTLALIVSLTGQYYTVLLQQDDVSVVLGGSPDLYDLKWEKFGEGVHSLTVINSGTRPVLITAVDVRFLHARDDKAGEDDCNGTIMFSRGYYPSPAVVKPGDIQVVLLRSGIYGDYRANDATIAKGDLILVCVVVSSLTPDSIFERRLLPTSIARAGVIDGGYTFTPDGPVPPQPLVQRSYMRFWKWHWQL